MPYVEERPDECPSGHPLRGPNRDVTVSWLPCLCASAPAKRSGIAPLRVMPARPPGTTHRMTASAGYPTPSFECRRCAEQGSLSAFVERTEALMMTSQHITAADLYQELQRISETVDRLYAEGRIAMSGDPTNTQWRDTAAAVAAVRASLDVATQAMGWMETRPNPESI